MARIECEFCAYCFDEALLVRQSLHEQKRMKEMEKEANQEMRAETNRQKLSSSLAAAPGV